MGMDPIKGREFDWEGLRNLKGATEGRLELSSLSRQLSDIFAEDSDIENDQTFHGFCDDELSDLDNDKSLGSDDDSEHSSPKRSQPHPQRFTLRVALRPRTRANFQEETELGDAKKEIKPGGGKSIPLIRPTPISDSESDSEEDSFLEKRALNIKSNKAMLAQLMADLQKMPDSLLKAPGGRQKRSKARAPRTSLAPSETRRNPERTSRRHTRSMGGCAENSLKEEKELEMSLEEELLEVRRPPRRRGSPQPYQGKPHVVRPVEDVTQDELDLVADSLVGKIYNRATGSTCHQCRQKTIDTKTCCRDEGCRGIQGQFCGPCLRNRYGEDVRAALLDPTWRCPPCRGICNCSFCRQREGRYPTGILFPLAQFHGFSNVHAYLSSLREKLKTGDEDE